MTRMTRPYPIVALALAGAVQAQLTLAPVAARPGESLQAPFGFYDAQRGRVTLVGGLGFNSVVPRQLLQYEGLDSMELTTSSPFPLRAYGATAVDATGTVVLFGGLNSDVSRSDETWRWDPTLPGAVPVPGLGTRPASRSHTAMTLDRRSGAVVLFGGVGTAGDLGDTWLWRSGGWTQVFPATAPTPRSGHAMAFDPASGRVVLFGGTSQATLLSDTWAFDGSNWVTVPVSGPSPRSGHVMALDEARGEVVLVGGDVGGTTDSGETWVLRPSGWQLRAGSLPYSVTGTDGTLVFDARRQQLVHTGGRRKAPFFGWLPSLGTRTWDGTAWASLGGTGTTVAADPYPSPRLDAMTAFDSSRGRIVAFGGQLYPSNEVVAETWEFGDGVWALRAPPQAPSRRRFGAMAAGAGACWLFGGENALGTIATDDLWRWDGIRWTLAPTGATRPPARTFANMAFDPNRNRLVLYGGLDQATNSLADAWEYDVNAGTWAPGSGTPPSARLAPAMCWHAGRGTIVLHGGQLPGTTLSPEFWEYDGRQWALRNSTGPALDRHSMAFDAARSRVVVTDGQNTWEFDGRTWQAFGTGAVLSPSLVYDTERQQCVAVSLIAWSFLALSAWTGSAWSVIPPAPGLGTRSSHSLTFDPVRHLDVLIGGVDGGATTGDWWDWDGHDWRRTLPVHRLPARQDHAATWLSGENKVLVFGGRAPNNAWLGDTWLLDAANKDWIGVAGTGPSPRSGHALCMDEAAGRAVLFGGDDGAATNDTWTFTRASGWVPVSAFVRPPARTAHAMAWYPPTGKTLVFGGSGSGGLMNDTWQFSASAGWSQVVTAHVPPARQGHVLLYDPVRARLVLHGGFGAGLVTLQDVWEYDGSDWIQRTPETTSPALVSHAATFDAARGRVVLSSGASLHQLWSNVDPAGVGDPAAPLPLTYETQPVVGDVFRLAFPVNGAALVYFAAGPATTPRLVLPPPLGCRNLRMFVDLLTYVPTNAATVDLGIPANPALVGARLTFQALTLGGANCLTATDALDAVLLSRS
ncbi:MAG: kelch repeat-containing protein [Planctomycetota bacterium]